MQIWIAQSVTPVFLATQLKKYALVQAKELFDELSNEQIVEETDELADGAFVSKIFYNIAEAMAWLNL